MKLVKNVELDNVKRFIKLMLDCPDSIKYVTVDKIVLETLISMVEVADEKP